MKHIADIKMYLKAMQKSDRFHMLIVQSAPGWGKSTTINAALEGLKMDHVSLGSYSTPLFFYNALVMHPNKTLILDDCAGLFDSPPARAILKAATWPSVGTGARIVTWGSCGVAGGGVASPVTEFKGNLVLLVNQLPNNEDVNAFKSRSFFYQIQFTQEEIAEMLTGAAKDKKYFAKPKISMSVAKHLIQSMEYRDTTQFNLRTLLQGYELAETLGSDWKRALDQLLPRITQESVVKQVCEKFPGSVEKAFREFQRITSKSRRTFMRIRAELAMQAPTRMLPQTARWSMPGAREEMSRKRSGKAL